MSIARPTALIRRAAALPIGLLDRVEASLDAGLDARFARVDSAVDRRISAVADRTSSISECLYRSSYSIDRALDQRVAKSDARTTLRIAKVSNTAQAIGLSAIAFEARTEAKLISGVQKFDRLSATATRTAISTMTASVALTNRADNKITRGFNRLDTRAANVASRAHARQAKTVNLAHRVTERIDQRIEIDYLRVDTRVNAGIHHTTATIAAITARLTTITSATDTKLSNAVTRVDARVEGRIAQGSFVATATANLVNTKALAFERAIDSGISRVDSRIANGVACVEATGIAFVSGVNSADQTLSGAMAFADYRVENRISQITYACAQTSTFAINRLVTADARLEGSVANFDTRVAAAALALVKAATAVSHFVVDHIDDTDMALTNKVTNLDAHADRVIDMMNGQSGRHANQPRTSLPWAATSLTLVLGTLGAATGASVVNASTGTTEIDTTVRIEASAAKDAVTQYLSVRDSFRALQASRSRSIQSLEQEIAAAEARITQVGLSGKEIIEIADNYGGVPYVRGGTTPKGFDCSGYTSYVFKQLGVSLPRTSQSQKAWSDPVSFEDRQVGDLMFWQGGGVHHVAIYAGDGKMWDSPRPGRRVGKSGIWGNPTYGRVPNEAINASALEEIATKKAELKKILEKEPQLNISINPKFILPSNEEIAD